MVEIACASSRTSPSKLEGVAEGRGSMTSGRIIPPRPSGALPLSQGESLWQCLPSIEAAMKCSDSFLVGRVIPNAYPALSLLRSSLRSGDIRRLGDKPPYHRSHNISLPEQ